MQGNPNTFAVSLKDAPCAEPACCIVSACCSPWGCTACWARKQVLDTHYNGIADFVCCQNYVGSCCCINPQTFFPGSEIGLCLEGCCAPCFSLSVARMHLMDAKRIQPDPMDNQIIAFSNALQLLSCICQIVAQFVEELRDAVLILDLTADVVTLTVAGCMGAQVKHELAQPS